MEAVVVVLALAVAGLLLVRSTRDGTPARPLVLGGYPGVDPEPSAHPTVMAALVARRPRLHIYAPGPVQLHEHDRSGDPGTDYTLSIARGPTGQWRSVLRAPEVDDDGSTLTLTLVVPWAELARRYSAVNLVVR